MKRNLLLTPLLTCVGLAFFSVLCGSLPAADARPNILLILADNWAWPHAGALGDGTVLAGGGVKRGYVHGASDAQGYAPTENPVTVGDFHATIAWAAGLPIEKEFNTASGRPMVVGNKGKPALGVFA